MSKGLYLKGTETFVARLDDDEFSELERLLVKEHPGDTDYFVDPALLDYLTAKGVSKKVRAALERALGLRDAYRGGASEEERAADDDGEGVEIEWREE
jgi:hypothetical protein